MDVRDRALQDLGRLAGVDFGIQPRFDAQEASYHVYKRRVLELLSSATGGRSAERLLESFLEVMPALLTAAAEYEGLDSEDDPAWIDDLWLGHPGVLAHSPILYPLNRALFHEVPSASPSLDLGMGNGQSSRFCVSGDLDVGADIIVSNLVKARAAAHKHRAVAAMDMGALPFVDASFARVYALNAIYHVQRGRKFALTEMARVLAPGGVLALTDVSAFIGEMKPLTTFFKMLGFEKLARDFTKYFLSGYGADGSPGVPEEYRAQLAELGFEDIRVEFLCAPDLSHLAYLLYDVQALFNFDLHARTREGEGLERWRATYRPMIRKLIAPLVRRDREACAAAGKGSYLFITARKRGASPASLRPWRESLRCPRTGERLDAGLRGASVRYPSYEGIPLLTPFFADAVKELPAGARARFEA